MDSKFYEFGVIDCVYIDQDGLCFFFFVLQDGSRGFGHEERNRQLEVTSDFQDVVFNPRRREVHGRLRWEIKTPEVGDTIICVIKPAKRMHHLPFTSMWAYGVEWWRLSQEAEEQRLKAMYADHDELDRDYIDPAMEDPFLDSADESGCR